MSSVLTHRMLRVVLFAAIAIAAVHANSHGGSVDTISVSVYFEDAAPTADTITPMTPSPTHSSHVSFTVGFSEDVQSFNDVSDLVITETGTVFHTGATITGGPQEYAVDVTGVTGDGTMTLAVGTESDVEDLAGNPLASSAISAPVIIDGTVKWVDFAFVGDEWGTELNPYSALAQGINAVTAGGTIMVKGDTETPYTPETPYITKALRIEAVRGTVRIGASSPKAASSMAVAMPESSIAAASEPDEAVSDTQDKQPDILSALLNEILDNVASEHLPQQEIVKVQFGTTFEPVMPFTVGPEGKRLVESKAPIAFRLRNANEILPESVQTSIAGAASAGATFELKSAQEGSLTDIWVILRPDEEWLIDEVLTVSAEAQSAAGEPVGPVTFEFREHGANNVWPADSPGLPPWAFSIEPQEVYEEPQRIWLPIPEGVDPNDVQLYYYKATGDDRGWYPGENVEGWLMPESCVVAERDGATYLGFLVRHAGIVQLGRAVDTSP